MDPSPQPAPRRLPANTARRLLSQITGVAIARATFYRWLQNGSIPAVKLVTRWYVEPQALRKFAQDAEFL